MPELPEVESARRILEGCLLGRTITVADVAADEIVVEAPREAVQAALQHRSVTAVCRRGKYLWLEFEGPPIVGIHLGMSGAVLDFTPGRERSIAYYRTKNVATPGERPSHLKLWLEAEGGACAFVDKRRFGRLWLSPSATEDRSIASLGPDAHAELPKAAVLATMLAGRKAPVKGVLLDQSFLAGIGNYLADEVLYQAGIAPTRPARSLEAAEVKRLHAKIRAVLRHAVEVDADYERFPQSWLFHYRWDGDRGPEKIGRHHIVRETVAGRTTAWVPARQR